MTRHKVSELSGALLDAAVAKAEGFEIVRIKELLSPDMRSRSDVCLIARHGAQWSKRTTDLTVYQPSWEARDGMPIIERERIHLTPIDAGGNFAGEKQERDGWLARHHSQPFNERGDTLLIAAMRASVAAAFGAEVDLT